MANNYTMPKHFNLYLLH